MTMRDQVEDVANRIQDPRMFRAHYAPYILRSMNRMYRGINVEIGGWEIPLNLPAGTFETYDYYQLPSYVIEVMRISPFRNYLDPSKFVFSGDSGESQIKDTYTIVGGYIHIEGVDETSEFDLWVKSSGQTLVDKADGDLEDGEINTPEWQWAFGTDLLFYATCLEVSAEYDMREKDIYEYNRLLKELRKIVRKKQSTTPAIAGGFSVATTRTDDYGR